MSRHQLLRRAIALPVSTVAEAAFTVFAIYHFSGAQLDPRRILSPGRTMPQEPLSVSDDGNVVLYLLNTGIYLLALGLSLRWPRRFWRACTADAGLGFLLVLILISVLWSAAPDIALRRAMALFGTSLFAIYLHLRYPLEQQLKLLGWGLGIGLVLSLLAITQTGVRGEGIVRGIYLNKNSLGRMMTLAALVYLFLAWGGHRRRVTLLFLAVSVVLVFLSGAASALVIVVTMLSAIPLLSMLKRDARPLVVIGCIGVLVVGAIVLVAPSVEAITGLVGRDATLTGRTALWAELVPMIRERFWLGYGYETFWLHSLGLHASAEEEAGWSGLGAHNGFLQVGLDLGILGLLLFVFTLVRGAGRAVQSLRAHGEPLQLWPLVYLCYLALYNLTEASALARNNVLWVLFVVTLLAVSSQAGRSTEAVPMEKGRTRQGFAWMLRYRPAGGRPLPTPHHLPSSPASRRSS